MTQLEQLITSLAPHLATPISNESTLEQLEAAFLDECVHRGWQHSVVSVDGGWAATIVVRNQGIEAQATEKAIALGSVLAHAINFDIGQNN